VHRTALRELGRDRPPGDAAVALVLKRLSDAQRDGDKVLALLGGDGDDAELIVGDTGGGDRFDPAELFGYAHAVEGLLAVAVATLALHHRARPRVGASAESWSGATADVIVRPLMAPPTRLRLHGHRDVSAESVPEVTLQESLVNTWPAPPDARHLTFDVHLPRVELPVIAPAVEIMPRAPWLPSVLADMVAIAAPSSIAETSEPVRAVSMPMTSPPPRAPVQTRRAHAQTLAASQAQQQQLAKIHSDYLARSAEIHQRYLAMQQQAQRILTTAYANAQRSVTVRAPTGFTGDAPESIPSRVPSSVSPLPLRERDDIPAAPKNAPLSPTPLPQGERGYCPSRSISASRR
jgi:hypothetical protein